MKKLKCRCGNENLIETSYQNNLVGQWKPFQRIVYVCWECGEEVFGDRRGFAEEENPIRYGGCTKKLPLERQLNLVKIGKPGVQHPGPDALRKEYDKHIQQIRAKSTTTWKRFG